MSRSFWLELARLAVLVLIAFPGTPVLSGLRTLWPQRAQAGCACSGRVCCCAIRPTGSGRRASCHEAPRTPPPAGSPRLRCQHSSDEHTAPSQPATLTAAPAATEPERIGAPAGPRSDPQEGHLRLASPPPWLPALS